MQCRAMHRAGCVDRPSTGAFAERFMLSASSVLPTADCVIYHLLTACLPLHDFSCLPCFAACRRAARLQFRFAAPLIYFVSASLLPGLPIAACGSLPTPLSTQRSCCLLRARQVLLASLALVETRIARTHHAHRTIRFRRCFNPDCWRGR